MERTNWQLEIVESSDFDVCRLSAYDAFIARIMTESDMRRLKATGKPTVDIFGKDEPSEFPCAEPDNGAIGRLAAEHFLSRRFSSFAYCGYEGIRYSDLRRKAFCRALDDAGFGCSVYASPPKSLDRFRLGIRKNETLGSDHDERQLSAWLRRLPIGTAVFCACDLKALQLQKAATACGRGVPEDLAILGVDDDPILCAFTSPQLSSINPNAFQVGQRAAALLDLLLKKRRVPAFTRIQPRGISVRASTEVYPIEPRWLSDALVFIHRHVAKNLTASQVYRHLGLSHTTVDAAFRQKLGTTVQKSIAQARLEEARRLLLTTDLPMTKIASLSGFASAAYFTRAFTAAYGKSPSEYKPSSG